MKNLPKTKKAMQKTGSVSMTDETPDFVCRGCGYALKNCIGTEECKKLLDGVVTAPYATPYAKKTFSAHLLYFA